MPKKSEITIDYTVGLILLVLGAVILIVLVIYFKGGADIQESNVDKVFDLV